FFPSRSDGASRPGRHALGSPRKQGQRQDAVADRPTSLTPSSNPRLGVGSHHQRLHRCALSGFLDPASETRAPTRILRHLPFATPLYHTAAPRRNAAPLTDSVKPTGVGSTSRPSPV